MFKLKRSRVARCCAVAAADLAAATGRPPYAALPTNAVLSTTTPSVPMKCNRDQRLSLCSCRVILDGMECMSRAVMEAVGMAPGHRGSRPGRPATAGAGGAAQGPVAGCSVEWDDIPPLPLELSVNQCNVVPPAERWGSGVSDPLCSLPVRCRGRGEARVNSAACRRCSCSSCNPCLENAAAIPITTLQGKHGRQPG